VDPGTTENPRRCPKTAPRLVLEPSSCVRHRRAPDPWSRSRAHRPADRWKIRNRRKPARGR